MESLNMSQLNISASQESDSRTPLYADFYDENDEHEIHVLSDPKNEYVCEYRSDIWNAMLSKDSGRPPFHLQSPQLEYRGSLVQLLRNIAIDNDYSILTLHTAVSLLDSFMDDHRLRVDRLLHVALACLSLAAKSEEKLSMVPSLKYLSNFCPHPLEGKTFRQLEWMIGQHVNWRLLAPTAASYAMLLAQYVITDADLSTKRPQFVNRFKRDGEERLNKYLNLSLSNVRLNLEPPVNVGCACVACTRADLGLTAWPPWLAARTRRKAETIAPIVRLLQRMMQILKSRENAESEIDQGYSSAKTSPSRTPSTSPKFQVSPASSSCSAVAMDGYRRRHRIRNDEYTVLDMDDSNPGPSVNYESTKLPAVVDMTLQRVDNSADYLYCRSSSMLDASLGAHDRKAVKRGSNVNIAAVSKRSRLLEPQ